MKPELKDLLDLLDLEQIEVNMFRGVSPDDGWQRVFGGQVIGQATNPLRMTPQTSKTTIANY